MKDKNEDYLDNLLKSMSSDKTASGTSTKPDKSVNSTDDSDDYDAEINEINDLLHKVDNNEIIDPKLEETQQGYESVSNESTPKFTVGDDPKNMDTRDEEEKMLDQELDNLDSSIDSKKVAPEEAAPVEATAPVEEAAPIEEAVSVEEAVPVEEAAPVEKTAPEEATAPEGTNDIGDNSDLFDDDMSSLDLDKMMDEINAFDKSMNPDNNIKDHKKSINEDSINAKNEDLKEETLDSDSPDKIIKENSVNETSVSDKMDNQDDSLKDNEDGNDSDDDIESLDDIDSMMKSLADDDLSEDDKNTESDTNDKKEKEKEDIQAADNESIDMSSLDAESSSDLDDTTAQDKSLDNPNNDYSDHSDSIGLDNDAENHTDDNQSNDNNLTDIDNVSIDKSDDTEQDEIIDGSSAAESSTKSESGAGVEKPEKEAKSKKNKDKKRVPFGTFFTKLFSFLTDGDDEDDAPIVANNELASITDENQQVLNELSAEDNKKAATAKNGKKVKEKKPKKKKAAKPKKQKPAKPKKEKKAKDKPVKVPGPPEKKIPKKKVITAIVFAITLGAMICIPVMILPNKSIVVEATSAYSKGDYMTCYQNLYGKKNRSEEEQLLYDKARTIAKMQHYYNSYELYLDINKPVEALNSLLKGVSEYDEISVKAQLIGDKSVENEVDKAYDTIKSALSDRYGLSEAQAKEILAISDDTEYTQKLVQIAGL